jgi:hypothetical protein
MEASRNSFMRKVGPLAIIVVFFLAVQWRASAQFVPQPPLKDAPTFTKDVAPVLYRHCTACHRPGQIAPMSLLTYEDARPYAKSILLHVQAGIMPPWYADPRHGEFENDRRLSAEERATIVRWVEGGAKPGDPRDLPPAPTYKTTWTMGEPDAVLRMQEDFPVPATGMLDYQYFEVPSGFTEDKWVQSIEIRPGAPSVVHHAAIMSRAPEDAQTGPSAYTSGPGANRRPGGARPGRLPSLIDHPPPRRMGPMIAVIGPRAEAVTFKPGTAMRIKAGSVLVFQMHYMPHGVAMIDRTQIGFKFAPQPPRYELLMGLLRNMSFVIPPRHANYPVIADATFTEDVTLWTMLPHAHLRAKSWEHSVMYPDGRSEIILSVPKYDHNWQTHYVFKSPLKIPKGTRIQALAHFDNSPQNPWNPDPDAEVLFGDQTWEEMMDTVLVYSLDGPRRVAVQLSPAVLARYAGTYQEAGGLTIVLTLENGRLMGAPRGRVKAELFAESETVFFLKGTPETVSFVPGPDGRAKEMIRHQHGDHFIAKRIE